MKSLRRIITFAYPYKAQVGLNVLFNLLATLFSLLTIGLVIPVLRIIFRPDPGVLTKPEYQGDILGYLENSLMYEIGIRIQDTGQQEALLYICFWVILAFFLKNLFRYLAMFSVAPLRNGITRDMRRALHSKILQMPIGFFTGQRKGDILSRMTTDLKEIENSILTTIEMVFREPIMIIASLAILVWMSPQLTVFVLILLPVVTWLITRIGKSLKRTSNKAQHQAGTILSQTEEDLTGLKVIKAFNAGQQKEHLFHRLTEGYFQQMNRVLRKRDLASPISEFLGAAVMALIIWYGGSLVMTQDSFTAEKFIAYVLFFYQIIPPAKTLSQASYKIQQGNASSERVLEILDAHNPIVDAPEALPIQEFRESITFKDVSFSYGQESVLKNINLKIPKGRMIALVGQSGGGKTTLTNLVPRFYDIDSGSLSIDGQEVRQLRITDLRKLMGIVTQETLLFNESVAYNIALGQPEATREDVEEAARIANAHDFIMELEEGYDTHIGDGGNKLSGGQKQRLSIARAVLKNPPILILDEATSALDTESEQLVQEALVKLMSHRTSLVIAHRLSTIQHADEIIVMHQGSIAEQGSHEELLSQDGIYRKLVDMQSFT